MEGMEKIVLSLGFRELITVTLIFDVRQDVVLHCIKIQCRCMGVQES